MGSVAKRGEGADSTGWGGADGGRICIIGPMKQLALGLVVEVTLGLETSVSGGNAELVHALQRIALREAGTRAVFLWGAPGSGRSHWLSACAVDALMAGRDVIRFDPEADPFDGPALHPNAVILADDAHLLDDAAQVRLFVRWNEAKENDAAIVVTGNAPPATLSVRADLATRLGWGLVYQVQTLSDAEKAAALVRHAHARGLRMGDDVAAYMMSHGRRDLPSLISALDALDRSSLEQHRPLTVPLLREVLQTPPVPRS
jgi:DnaA-homolog protein